MWLETTTTDHVFRNYKDRSCGKKQQRQIMWLETTKTDHVVRNYKDRSCG